MDNIDNPLTALTTRNIESFVLPNNDAPYLYEGEASITPEQKIRRCIKDSIPAKKKNYNRIMLFNVHNFVSICNIDGENREVGRQISKFTSYLNTSHSDVIFLTEVVPDYSLVELASTAGDRITKIKSSNHRKLVNELNTTYPHLFLKDTFESTHTLANAMFSKFQMLDKKIHDIGGNRNIIECKIMINEQPVILLLTHFLPDIRHMGYDYNENVRKTITIIRTIKRTYKYIIFGGDFNFPRFVHDLKMEGAVYAEGLEKLDEELVYVDPRFEKSNLGKITGFLKDEIIDAFYISRDFLLDFDFSVSIINNNLSDHNPVILEFKYIDTEIRKIDSELKFIFNEIFYLKFAKNLKESKLYYCNTDIRGYLDLKDDKYRFTQNCLTIKTIRNNIVYDNDVEKSTAEFKVELADFYKEILKRSIFYVPLINFFIYVIANKARILPLCNDDVCTIINSVDNFTPSELASFNTYLIDQTNKDAVEAILRKYYIVTHSELTSVITLFGFNVLTINYTEDLLDNTKYNKIELGTSKENIYVLKSPYQKSVEQSCQYLQDRRCGNSLTAGKSKFDEHFFYGLYGDGDKYDVTEAFLNNMETFLQSEPESTKKVFYNYTDKFSNLTRILQSNGNRETEWILGKDERVLNDMGAPYKISDVVRIFDDVYSRVPANDHEFHVYRATNLLYLDPKINIFKGIFSDIDIDFYQSTTFLKSHWLFGSYTNFLLPLVFEIRIPAGNKTIFLGNEFGQIGQQEVLLQRNCTLHYTGKKYSLLNSLREIKLYGLVIMFDYIKN